MANPRLTRNIFRILPFGVIWLIFGLLYVLLEYGLLADSTVYPSTKNIYSFKVALLSVPPGSFLMGILYGSIEILLLNKLFQRKKFWARILFKSIIYISFIASLSFLLSFVATAQRAQLPLFRREVFDAMMLYVTNFAFVSILIYASVVTILSLFILEVSDYTGGGIFNNFFIGKYNRPREEERIFMFLDMKSSTTIAEKLGSQEYFRLLNKYYADTSDAIIDTFGEVYQYAGDEVIVSWRMAKGSTDNHCLECFYAIKKRFEENGERYKKSFGLVPEFKAGFHCGKVTTGEIGTLKKDIFFTGDVLNTASRIQNLCNALETDILISHDLLLRLDVSQHYVVVEKGELPLRGRKAKMHLYSVHKV